MSPIIACSREQSSAAAESVLLMTKHMSPFVKMTPGPSGNIMARQPVCPKLYVQSHQLALWGLCGGLELSLTVGCQRRAGLRHPDLPAEGQAGQAGQMAGLRRMLREGALSVLTALQEVFTFLGQTRPHPGLRSYASP